MPGINIFITTNNVMPDQTRVSCNQEKMLNLFPRLQIKEEQPLPRIRIRLISHEGYPVKSCNVGNWRVLLESSNVNIEPEIMKELTRMSCQDRLSDIEAEQIRNSVLAIAPGALFILAINQVSEQVFFMNDRLARLPIYHVTDKAQFILARDISFVLDACDNLTPNPMYLALNTVFSYVPGHGTVYDEIDTLRGSTFGLYDVQTGDLRLHDDPNARFIEQDHGGKKRDRLNGLLESFAGATKRISNSINPVIALSGGFDSRAVIASMHAQNIGFDAVTYQDAENTAQEDPRIAGLIAAKLGCSHRLVTMSRIEDIHYEKLFAIKAGINYLGVAHFLQFLEELAQAYPGGYTLVTGDGGDKVMPNLAPQDVPESDADLLSYIFKHNSMIDYRFACTLFNIAPEQMHSYMLRLLKSYPATTQTERYKCFLLAERAGRWLFEGEDRNRFYGGMETPFYDFEFYRDAMRIPDQWKSDRSFYRNFLLAQSPALSSIKIANGILKPSQIGYGTIVKLLDLLRKQEWLVQIRQRQKQGTIRFYSQDWLIGEISSILTHPWCSVLIPGGLAYLSESRLKSLNRSQMNCLYTVMRVIDWYGATFSKTE